MLRSNSRQLRKPLFTNWAPPLASLHLRAILAGMTDQKSSPGLAAVALTAAGAIPFVGLAIAIAVLDPPSNATAALWLQTYAAIILSFLGGIRWGLALAQPGTKAGTLALSVCPSLAGWAILPPAIILVPSPSWFLAYAGLFAVQLVWDLRSTGVPSGFKPVRLWVSIVVIAALIGAWAIQHFGF